jgi:hypothetical protein
MQYPKILLFIGFAIIVLVIVMHLFSKLPGENEHKDQNLDDQYSDMDYEDRMLKSVEDILTRIEALERQNREIVEKLNYLIGQQGNPGDEDYE